MGAPLCGALFLRPFSRLFRPERRKKLRFLSHFPALFGSYPLWGGFGIEWTVPAFRYREGLQIAGARPEIPARLRTFLGGPGEKPPLLSEDFKLCSVRKCPVQIVNFLCQRVL